MYYRISICRAINAGDVVNGEIIVEKWRQPLMHLIFTKKRKEDFVREYRLSRIDDILTTEIVQVHGVRSML